LKISLTKKAFNWPAADMVRLTAESAEGSAARPAESFGRTTGSKASLLIVLLLLLVVQTS